MKEWVCGKNLSCQGRASFLYTYRHDDLSVLENKREFSIRQYFSLRNIFISELKKVYIHTIGSKVKLSVHLKKCFLLPLSW